MFIPPGPEYPHQILNTSDKVLKYLSFSINADMEICEYPDSNKYLAFSRTRGRSSTVAKCTARRTISTIGTGKHDVRQLPTRSGANLASNSASRLHVRHN